MKIQGLLVWVGDRQKESKLGVLLIERWCWGSLSLPALQRLAAAAEEDGLDMPLIRTDQFCLDSFPPPTNNQEKQSV